MDVNFELYKFFYMSAKTGSFSEAADLLFVSQSAVSQAIKKLEEKLGLKLFTRNSKKIKLTKEGEIVYRHIEQAYNFIKLAETKLVELKNITSGEVKIGVSDTICRYYLIPYLKDYNTKFPGVKIQVINRTSVQILELLKNAALDFGIVTMPVNESEITATEFINVEDIFVAGGKYSNLSGREISVNELSSYPLLMLHKGSTTRQNLDSFLDKSGICINPEIELENVDLLLEFARIGFGIAHVLKKSAMNYIDRGELFEIEIKETLPTRSLGIATIKDVPLSFAAKGFIDMLEI